MRKENERKVSSFDFASRLPLSLFLLLVILFYFLMLHDTITLTLQAKSATSSTRFSLLAKVARHKCSGSYKGVPRTGQTPSLLVC